MSPITLFLMTIFVIAIINSKRKWAMLIILLSISLFSLEQRISFIGFDFPVMRIVVIAGLFRVISKKETKEIVINDLDRAVILWTIVSFVIYCILYRAANPIFLKVARTIDYSGTYLICRALIRNTDDIKEIMKFQTIIIIIFSMTMLIEFYTRKNPLSYIGNIGSSYVRDGKYRCKGVFLNSLTAGTFGANSLPFVFGAWVTRKISMWAFIAGISASAVVTYTASSSGAAMAFIFCLIGLILWFKRKEIKLIRNLFLFTLIFLHFAMNAPIWYLFAKLSNYIGGTGWHRSFLIDQAIRYIGDWWLIGTTYTAHWFPYTLPGNPNHADITNQFLMMGVDGGLITMILYIIVIVKAFGSIGTGLNNNNNNNKDNQILYWTLGAALLGHLASFFSITYYDQIGNFFYLFLAMIAKVNEASLEQKNEIIIKA